MPRTAISTDDMSPCTGGSVLQFCRGNRPHADPARVVEAVAQYADTGLPNSKRKPQSKDRGSCSRCDRPNVNRGLRTGELRLESGGPTWGLGEKPRIPCAWALRF